MERCTYVTLVVVACVVYVVATSFNSLAGGAGKGIFKSETGDISDKYELDITPSSWVFSIWGVIYVWLTLFLIYAIANIFRRTELGFAFNDPELMSAPFFVLFTINMGMNLAWIFLFDREVIIACFIVLFLMYVTLYICLFLSYKALYANIKKLEKSERTKDIWLTRILVQNGISTYATWCTIATNLNLNMMLCYRTSLDLSIETGGTIALSVIAAQIVIFVVLDFIFWDNYTRYTFTPYLVIVVALIGSLTKNYTEGARNSIFTIVLLSVAGLLVICKITLSIIRHMRKPIGDTIV